MSFECVSCGKALDESSRKGWVLCHMCNKPACRDCAGIIMVKRGGKTDVVQVCKKCDYDI